MKSTLIKLIVCIFVIGGLNSCRTVRGAGQDVQHLGSKIEREASKHSY